jgi:hypothetical protein
MPVTILDYVKSIVGDKPEYSAGDFSRNGVEMLGGCERCHATIAAYNAYPATSGYWRCADCIGDDGYDTVTAFQAAEFSRCPGCGAPDSIYETPITVSERTYGYVLKCAECDLSWINTT